MEKKYKILIILLIGYILIVFLILFLYNRMHIKHYMVLSPNDVFEYKNNHVEKVPVNTLSNHKELKFYIEGKSVGKYKLKFDKTIQIIGENQQVTGFSDDTILGISPKSKIRIYPYSYEELNQNDYDELHMLLSQKGINGYDELSVSHKISYDFDNDGNQETIYLLSNAFIEETHDKVFSFVYYKDTENSKILLEKIGDISLLENCTPLINNLADWNSDKKIDLIIGCHYFDQLGSEYDFLENQDGIYYSILK